jgi:hypothetical protein
MTAFDAECTNEKVNRLSNRDPSTPQDAVIRCSFYRQFRVDQRNSLESPERPLYEPRLCVSPETLEYLAQDQVSNQQRRGRYQLAKPTDRLGDELFSRSIHTELSTRITEVSALTALVQIAFPVHLAH